MLPLPFSGKDDHVIVVIETSRGSRIKYAYEQSSGLFRMKKVLPLGLAFPVNFGFIPHTKGEDGDPVDVVVLLDEPLFHGSVVECRVIGVIAVEQTELGKRKKNHRILAVPVNVHQSPINALKDVEPSFLEELVGFFRYYVGAGGENLEHTGTFGKQQALKHIKNSLVDRKGNIIP